MSTLATMFLKPFNSECSVSLNKMLYFAAFPASKNCKSEKASFFFQFEGQSKFFSVARKLRSSILQPRNRNFACNLQMLENHQNLIVLNQYNLVSF